MTKLRKLGLMSEGIEGIDFVLCQFCLQEGKCGKFKKINSLHFKTHNKTVEEYKKEFPNQLLEASCIHEQRVQTNLKNYGVVNVSQLAEVKQQKERTNLEHFNVKNPSQAPEIKEQKKKTTLEHFGVANPMQSEKIKEKTKQTNLKNFGVEHPMQLEKIRKKRTQSCLAHHGVENPMQSLVIQEKRKQTSLLKYGVAHALQSPESQKKRKETLALKSEIFSYIGRNGDTRYLSLMSKPEEIFNSRSPDNIMFTGDKVFHILTPEHVGSKSANPDFLVMPIKETKKVIEIFGAYIHSIRPGIPKEEAAQEKITQYDQVGYQCLIIWDDDLLEDSERELKRVKDFCGTYWERLFEEDISLLKKIKITRARHKKRILKNIAILLAREEPTEERQKKKLRICQGIIKELNLVI